jgi:hypothetical protein
LTNPLNWRPLKPMFRRPNDRPTLLARTTATLAVLLVLALTVLAASPELHERVHGHGAAAQHEGSSDRAPAPAEHDDGCVVTLFAQGVVLALALLAFALLGRVLPAAAFSRLDRIIPEAPRYLRLPTQGPPLGLN